MSLLFYRFIGF